MAGDLDKWNVLLDRIFQNLSYRIKTTQILDEQKKIIGIEINDPEYEENKLLIRKIVHARSQYKKFFKSKKRSKTGILFELYWRSRWYQEIVNRELWLRKFMHGLGLYLKEIQSDPGTAMLGSFGRERST